MNDNMTTVREPLFHIVKRSGLTTKQAVLIRVYAVLAGLLLCGIICTAIFKVNPFSVYFELFMGAFGTTDRIWYLVRDTALLLGVGLALIPAFKMKFWNLGGNGQVLMGCLASVACMHYLGGKIPDILVNILMIITSIAAGALWAVIPAIFKANFKTNESLFTLMMNYIAAGIVLFCIDSWVKTGSGVLVPIKEGSLITIGNDHVLTILVVAILTAFMYVYLKFTKHGYELTVVGESENTARYVGINVKKVIIRTLVLSGAICGIIGLLLGGSINHTVTSESAANRGFTGIMVAWLAKFDPLMMIVTAFGITFLSRGMGQVQSAFGITNAAVSDIIIGLIYFCVIGCEFFINYRIISRGKKNGKKKGKSVEAAEATVPTENDGKGGKE
mgnify:FL=1